MKYKNVFNVVMVLYWRTQNVAFTTNYVGACLNTNLQ